jgi:DNA-binding transcriptional ArsR family regulator
VASHQDVVGGRDDVIEFRLSVEALGRSRFAYSPLGELASSLRTLWAPHIDFVLQPWRRAMEKRLRTTNLELLRAICPPGGLAPNFMFVSSSNPKITLEGQLEALTGLPVDQLRSDLLEVWPNGPLPDPVAGALDRDAAAFGRHVADALWTYWSLAVAPHWQRIHAVIEDDVSYRAAAILGSGLYGLFSDLHPEISLHGTSLMINKPHHHDAVYTDGELTLIPSVFVWPHLIIGHDISGHFDLHYAARGVGNVWTSDAPELTADTLGELLGRTRAAILARLSVPLTTTQLARELGQSPATVSEHLSVLRRSGMLNARRSGRLVFYFRTPLGSSVVAAAAFEQGTG